MPHYKLVKLLMQLNASCMVLGAGYLRSVGFWRAGYVIILSSSVHATFNLALRIRYEASPNGVQQLFYPLLLSATGGIKSLVYHYLHP